MAEQQAHKHSTLLEPPIGIGMAPPRGLAFFCWYLASLPYSRMLAPVARQQQRSYKHHTTNLVARQKICYLPAHWSWLAHVGCFL